MRIALIGAVESTAVTLAALCSSGQPPVAVLSLPATYSDRHSDFVDMEKAATDVGVEFRSTINVNDDDTIAYLGSLQLDWLIVVGWSQICSPDLLAIAKEGAIGYHPALLPKMRGRAVIAWTILLGLEETAGSLFMMEPTVDSGALLAQQRFEVAADETVASLLGKHMRALTMMWSHLLPLRRATDHQLIVQDQGEASYCARRTASDGLIDWNQPALMVERLVRAVSAPYPGAFTFYQGHRLCVDQAVEWTGARHYGTPGQVLERRDGRLLIACGEYSALSVLAWRWDDHADRRAPAVGRRLGIGAPSPES